MSGGLSGDSDLLPKTGDTAPYGSKVPAGKSAPLGGSNSNAQSGGWSTRAPSGGLIAHTPSDSTTPDNNWVSRVPGIGGSVVLGGTVLIGLAPKTTKCSGLTAN